MDLEIKRQPNGITINNKYQLKFPKLIWQAYPEKEFLTDNLAHLLTINTPLISKNNKVNYNTSLPLLKSFFSTAIINSIAHSTDDYDQSTQETIKQFLNIDYKFKNNQVKYPNYKEQLEENAIVSFSAGKDSLLSLAAAQELDLNPVGVYINDTVSPTENKLKLKHMEKISNEHKIPIHIVKNELEKLNDFETWDTEETCLGYTHMLTGFSLLALPFSHYYKAKHIIVGNQEDMNFYFVNKEGYRTYPAYDQTREWMRQQNIMLSLITNKEAKLSSLIQPLTNIAIMRVLFKRYPDFAKYEISCDCLDASLESRWCHECSKCARLGLFLVANNINPKIANLKPLFNKEHKKLYCLFQGKEADCYEKSEEARDQQLLAFYLAYKNKARGYLIDLFKKQFLAEAQEREDQLINHFFKLHSMKNLPKNIVKPLKSIYSEELNNI
ncbi:hypothetical protein HOD38_00205 [archaeon]|jgi:7-cyano-7-deazaguanine synthase in queuosine biosynthesis|nr:hypothetical protein [archaeon]MBT4396668.1 hypothetical protein [archaeon]MBT4441278.1 hypothetical protein [archaeon]